MKDRCPHGMLRGEKLCAVATCPEWDGMKVVLPYKLPSTRTIRRNALSWCSCGQGFKPDGHDKCPACRVCGNCEERPPLPKGSYCRECLDRFAQDRPCRGGCGRVFKCKSADATTVSVHIKRDFCKVCLRRYASTDNNLAFGEESQRKVANG